MRITDLVADVVVDHTARRTRVLLMLTAIAFATGSLVTALGISTTAAQQIDADLAAAATDTLTLTPNTTPSDEGAPSGDGPDPTTTYFPAGAAGQVEAIDLVDSAGLRLPVSTERVTRPTGDSDPGAGASDGAPAELRVVGATSGYLATQDVASSRAWMLDTADSSQQPGAGLRVAFLDTSAASALGVPPGLSDYTGYRVVVDDVPLEVVDVVHGPATAGAVLVPYQLALHQLDGSATDAQMLVRTRPGAGPAVARVVREAVHPDRPQLLSVSTAVSLESLRQGVATQLDRFAAAIGAVLLVLTTLLIANSMVTAVVTRTPEIGLRRALGASRATISGLFLVDGALSGVLGGLAGSALGTSAIVVVAWLNRWTAIMTWHDAVLGPAVGLVVGLTASAYPAVRAAAVSPAEAVRAE
ncbi:ABC transporter permease [Isoptericola sp. NPDC055881]